MLSTAHYLWMCMCVGSWGRTVLQREPLWRKQQTKKLEVEKANAKLLAMRVKFHNIRQANSKIEKRKQTSFYNNEGNIIIVEKEKIKNCNHTVHITKFKPIIAANIMLLYHSEGKKIKYLFHKMYHWHLRLFWQRSPWRKGHFLQHRHVPPAKYAKRLAGN